jgi:poly-beta-hydroxyalkanoate depolymerase
MSNMEKFWSRSGALVSKQEYIDQIKTKIIPAWATKSIPAFEEVQAILNNEKFPRSLVHAITQEDTFLGQEEYRELFIHHYRKTNNLAHSAALIGVSASAVRQRRKKDKIFAKLMDLAEEQYADQVKSVFQDLALNGTEKHTYDRNGNLISTERVIHGRLLELEMKRVDPSYNEKREVAHTVAGGVLVAPAEVSIDQWEKQYNRDEEGYNTGLQEEDDMLVINPT